MALPQLGGPGAGRSVYEDVAGNHVLIRAETFKANLDGRLDATGAIKAYLSHLVGAGLARLCTLLIITTFLDLAWSIRAAGSVPTAALAILLTDISACLLVWMLPRSLESIA